MLPAAARLTRRADFTSAVRRGRRATGRTLMVHLAQGAGSDTRAGFIVDRAVGGSVMRHRVQRRLRHLVRDRLDRVPPGSLLVVRALPPAAAASSTELSGDLDSALRRARSAGRPR